MFGNLKIEWKLVIPLIRSTSGLCVKSKPFQVVNSALQFLPLLDFFFSLILHLIICIWGLCLFSAKELVVLWKEEVGSTRDIFYVRWKTKKCVNALEENRHSWALFKNTEVRAHLVSLGYTFHSRKCTFTWKSMKLNVKKNASLLYLLKKNFRTFWKFYRNNNLDMQILSPALLL